MESAPVREIDPPSKDFLKSRPKSSVREERDRASPLDEEVDVAVRRRLSPSDGPEYPQFFRSVSPGEPEDRGAMGKNDLLDPQTLSEPDGSDPWNIPIPRLATGTPDDRGPDRGPRIPAPEAGEPGEVDIAQVR